MPSSLPLEFDLIPLQQKRVRWEKDRPNEHKPVSLVGFSEGGSQGEKRGRGEGWWLCRCNACINLEMQLAADYGGVLALPTAILVAGAQTQAKNKVFLRKVSSICEDASSYFVPMLANFSLPHNVL